MRKRVTVKDVEELHREFLERLRTRLQEKDVTDATLAIARLYLKDQGSTADPSEADDIAKFRELLDQAKSRKGAIAVAESAIELPN